MIRKVGNQWCLFTADGSRRLGCHDTREDALAQERAVQANKGIIEPIVIEYEDGSVEIEADAEITKALDEEQIVYGVILVPFKRDLQGDVVSDKQIRDAAHAYLTESRKIKDMHTQDVKADIVESAIAPPGGLNWYGKIVPEGTWVGAFKVHDPTEWDMIKRGLRRGLSVRMRGRKLVEVPA